jgi:Putative transposase/Transposase zinc-binding domain
MVEVADILGCHGPDYARAHTLLPSQKKVLRDLVRCRTPACGGQLYRCDHCGRELYSYHSCGNRHCPKCHGKQIERWLETRRARLLPCDYYLLTFTVPQQLHPVSWSHQKALYGLLLSSAAAALQKLAGDPRYVGGQLAILAVLHTWTRALLYHPHVHLLVSAGGLAPDNTNWRAPKNPAFLVPCFALSKIWRGKIRAGLQGRQLLDQVDPAAWEKDWVVHCRHAGTGEKALEYLARYVFRTAISNSRLESFANGRVTFRYRDNQTQQIRHVDLGAPEFIRRFFQHVLPKGFVKVRSYGLWSGACRKKLALARGLLGARRDSLDAPDSQAQHCAPCGAPALLPCPHCKSGHLVWVQSLPRQPTRGP